MSSLEQRINQALQPNSVIPNSRRKDSVVPSNLWPYFDSQRDQTGRLIEENREAKEGHLQKNWETTGDQVKDPHGKQMEKHWETSEKQMSNEWETSENHK